MRLGDGTTTTTSTPSETSTTAGEPGMKDWIRAITQAMRSPLTAVAGFLELSDERWDELSDEERRRHIAICRAQTGRAVRLLERVELIGTLGGTGATAARQPAGLTEVVGRIVDEVSPALGVRIEVPDRLSVAVQPSHLELMVDDIVSTAARLGARSATLQASQRDDRVDVGMDTDVPANPDRRAVFGPPGIHALLGGDRGVCNLWFLGRVAELNGGSAFYGPTARGGSRWGVTLPAAARPR